MLPTLDLSQKAEKQSVLPTINHTGGIKDYFHVRCSQVKIQSVRCLSPAALFLPARLGGLCANSMSILVTIVHALRIFRTCGLSLTAPPVFSVPVQILLLL